MKIFETFKKNKLRCGCLVILLLITFLVTTLGLVTYLVRRVNLNNSIYLEVTPDMVSAPITDIITEEVFINETKTFGIPDAILTSESRLPSFIRFSNGNLIVNPQKGDNGEYFVKFKINNVSTVYSVKVKNSGVDLESMKGELKSYLNKKGLLDNYGIYVKDLNRGVSTDINGATVFPPASMAKMTMAILIMRDIDAGKYTLDSTYPIQDNLKFNDEDDLGKLPNGNEVPIHTYLERLIEDSNNTAWYHMDAFLGGSYEVVNPRTIDELGVNPLFLNPHIGTANSLGKLFEDLYAANTVTPESRDYLIDLMKNALEWNREGIGLGLPNDVEFANKIGNLWTDADVNFCDSAIVYGKNTNYILIIMNKDIDWDSGKQNLKDLSSIVYSYLDK